MSKNAKTAKPEAEWRVRMLDSSLENIPASRMRLDESGGYTFRDSDGIVADFPPMTVACVARVITAAADPGPIETGAP